MSGFEAQWQAEEMFAMACMIMGVLTALPDRFAAAGRWGGRHPPPPPPPYYHHAHAHHHGAGDVVQSPQAFAAAAVLHHLSGGRLKQPPGPQQHLPPHHNPQRGTFPVPRQGVLDVRMVPTTPSAVAQTAQTLLCKHNANNNTSKHQNNVSSNNNNNSNKTNCAPTTQKNKKAQQQPRRILSTPLTASPPTAAATAVATPVTSEKASTATNSSSGTYNGRRNPRKRYKKRPAAEIASTTEGSVRDENENRTPSTATTVADVIGDDAVEAQSRVEVVPTTCTPEIQGVVVESSEVNTREDCGEGAEGVEQGSVTSPATRTTTPQKEEREGEAEAEEETEADENRCDPDHCAKQKEEDVIAEESPDKKNDDDDDTAPILAHASSTTTTSHLLSPAMDDNLLCATTATTATSSTMPSSQQSEQLEDNDETAVDMEENNNNNNDDADDYGEEEEADADPNAVRISYRNCDYELSGEWSTIRVHTLKRQLAAVLGLRSNDIVLVVDGDAVEDDLAVASELGIGSGADVAVRGVDDETPLCASPPLPPRTHMDSSQTPLSSQCMCPDCVAYYSYWGTMSPPFDAQPQAPPQHHDIPPTPCNASLCFCDACVGAVAAATPSVAHELDSAAAPQPPATLVLPGPVPSGSPTHSECADVMSTSFASSCAPHAQTQTSSSSLLRRRRSSHSSAASSLSSPLLNGDVRGSNSNLLQHSGSGTQQQQQQVPQQVASSSSFRSVPSTTSQSTAVGLAPSASQKWRFDPYNTDGYIVLQQ
eukprot:PhM_4_TR8404/c1_g1_i1/m.41154